MARSSSNRTGAKQPCWEAGSCTLGRAARGPRPPKARCPGGTGAARPGRPPGSAAAGRDRAPRLRWRLARAPAGGRGRVAASGPVSGGEPRPAPSARGVRAKAPRDAAVCRPAPALRVFKPSGWARLAGVRAT